MAQVVRCPPNKYKAVSSNSHTAKKTPKNKKTATLRKTSLQGWSLAGFWQICWEAVPTVTKKKIPGMVRVVLGA
jgi:hypothetical protein